MDEEDKHSVDTIHDDVDELESTPLVSEDHMMLEMEQVVALSQNQNQKNDEKGEKNDQVAEAPQQTFPRASDEEVMQIRKFLGRLQREVAEAKKGKDVTVTLTKEDVELLYHLFGRGLLRAPSRMSSKLRVTKKMLSSLEFVNTFAHVIQEFLPKVHVAFRDLTYTVKIPIHQRPIDTVGGQCMDILRKLFACLTCKGTTKNVEILNHLSGAFLAGTSTLVLGPPGSGMTTLFKVLAGHIEDNVTGERYYTGRTPKEVRVRLLSEYVDQTDNHIPILTVNETFDFAFRCAGGAHRGEQFNEEATEEEIEHVKHVLERFPEFVTHNYGLDNCANTIVGNAMIRGVSGGERRRVTTAEKVMLRAPLVFYDSISNGLDSKTTFDICRRICNVGRKLHFTPIVSLLQPPVDVYNLFDEILIMMYGNIIYHGERENVLPYFESIGYRCPADRDIADFIQEIATEDRDQYCFKEDAPKTDAEMVQAWLSSPFYEKKKQEIDAYCTPNANDGSTLIESKFSMKSPLYQLDVWKDMGIVLKRHVALTLRDNKFIIARLVQALLMGTIIGTVFVNQSADISPNNIPGITQRYGLVFTSILQMMLTGMSGIPVVLTLRPVFYKQQKSYFFRTTSYVMSETITNFPISLCETIIFGSLIFWISALVPRTAPDVASEYITFLVLLTTANVSVGGILRAIGAASPSMGVAQTVAGVMVAFCVLFGGFIITPNNIPPWFIWIYWLVPVSWALRSIIVSIFTSEWAMSTGDGYLALNLFGFQTNTAYIWGGFGVLLLYAIINLFISILSYNYIRYEGGGKKIRPEEVGDIEPSEGKDIAKCNEAAERAPGDHEVVDIDNDGQVSTAMQIRRDSSKETLRSSFKPASIIFRDLWYSVQAGSGTIDLLQGISGHLMPGTMTALMGSSGAGKTTLMDVIAGRKTGGEIRGEILVNGRPKDALSFARVIGYAEQMDIHSAHASVKEALMFSATLRQESSVPYAEKEKFVDAVMVVLGLEKLQANEIGTKSEGGLSVEEAKRVTIGVELAANPSILFADEPTSGLDAKGAMIVMKAITRVAQAGRTVVCTIHQPSKDIFCSFDHLLLLKRGGKMVYFGELGEGSQKLIDYLEAIPGTVPMPPRYNPATYMLDVISASNSVVDYAHEYEVGALRVENEQEIDKLAEQELEEKEEIKFESYYASGYPVQQLELIKKWWLTYWRTPSYNFTRIAVNIFMGLLFGTAFLQQVPSTPTKAQSFLGVIFLSTVFIGVISLNTTIPVLFSEREAFYREKACHMYSAFPYLVSYTLAELPYLLVSTLIFQAIFYFLVGFWLAAEKFFLFWFIFFLYLTVVTFLGQMLASLMPSQQLATMVAGMCSGLFSLFAGFTIAVKNVPVFWQFMTYLSPLRFAFDALVTTQMECTSCYVDTYLVNGSSVVPLTCNNGMDCAQVCDLNMPGCHFFCEATDEDTGACLNPYTYVTAWTYLQTNWGFGEITVWVNIGALIGFIVGYRILTGLAMAFVDHQKR